ncbi:unnamed protein product [Aphanomyces euteiches]|uniref:Major facilitator superfamily (MFS) profile domain-containing protein n=1 Tax=Aphanomyces euteiches TaxID=100861 RepID=A0A6G0X8J8_9STRA|nr:hypothetical protein Ae201684_007390 [Aphanomyces euteiches]KAH9100935.1 hypothetical protein Ae201684P_007126 [Aphanomyces euteiches]KAH9135478.1 hypothetical protein AeRB84_019144 [Aphanomyces euteiches]
MDTTTPYVLVDDASTDREKPRRVSEWHVQLMLIYASQLAAESSRGLVLPTLFLYCESLGGGLSDMGHATSVFSVGRLVASVFLGWLCDRVSFRTVHLVCAAISVLGNLLYVLPMPPTLAIPMLLLSRFVTGVGAGSLSVCRANIAVLTPKSLRLLCLNRLALVVFVGYALSPGLGGLFAHVDVQIVGNLHLTAFTAPGYILVVLNAASFVAMWFAFDCSITAADAPSKDEQAPEKTELDAIKQVTEDAPELSCQFYSGVAIFVLLNVVGRGVIAVFETILVTLHVQVVHLDHASAYGNAVRSAASFEFTMGVLGLLTYAAVEFGHLADELWLLLGLAMFVLGNGLLLAQNPLQWPLFCAGIYLVWSIGGPLLTAVSVSAFSRSLGSRPQGLWMGIFGAAGSCSRIVLPVVPALVSSFRVMFWINLALSAFGLLLLCWWYSLTSWTKRSK